MFHALLFSIFIGVSTEKRFSFVFSKAKITLKPTNQILRAEDSDQFIQFVAAKNDFL